MGALPPQPRSSVPRKDSPRALQRAEGTAGSGPLLMPWSGSRAVAWKIADVVEPKLGAERIFPVVERAAGELGTVPPESGLPCSPPREGGTRCWRECPLPTTCVAAPIPRSLWGQGHVSQLPGDKIQYRGHKCVAPCCSRPRRAVVGGVRWRRWLCCGAGDGDSGRGCLGLAGLPACMGVIGPLHRVRIQPVRGMRG